MRCAGAIFRNRPGPDMVALIGRVFGCPVLVHYSHSERAVMAGSMPDDPRYFVWPLYGHVELVDEAGRTSPRPACRAKW